MWFRETALARTESHEYEAKEWKGCKRMQVLRVFRVFREMSIVFVDCVLSQQRLFVNANK